MKKIGLVTLFIGFIVGACTEQLPRRPGGQVNITSPCESNPAAEGCEDIINPPPQEPPLNNPPQVPDVPYKDLIARWEVACDPNESLATSTQFLFGANGEGQYKWIYYRDCAANRIDFLAIVSFTYSVGAAGIVEGSKKLDLVVTSVKLYSDDAATIQSFNQEKNCGLADWKRSEAREVGNLENYCDIGLQVKNNTKIFNLYKVGSESLLLGIPWIGESDEAGNSGVGSPQNRPVTLNEEWMFKKK